MRRAEPARGEIRAGGEHVVVAEQRGEVGMGAEQGQRRVARLLRYEVGGGGRGVAGERLERLAPQAEGRALDGRGEVADAPVPELLQVADRGRRAALDVQPHAGMPADVGLDQHDRVAAVARGRGGSMAKSSSPSAGPACRAAADAVP